LARFYSVNWHAIAQGRRPTFEVAIERNVGTTSCTAFPSDALRSSVSGWTPIRTSGGRCSSRSRWHACRSCAGGGVRVVARPACVDACSHGGRAPSGRLLRRGDCGAGGCHCVAAVVGSRTRRAHLRGFHTLRCRRSATCGEDRLVGRRPRGRRDPSRRFRTCQRRGVLGDERRDLSACCGRLLQECSCARRAVERRSCVAKAAATRDRPGAAPRSSSLPAIAQTSETIRSSSGGVDEDADESEAAGSRFSRPPGRATTATAVVARFSRELAEAGDELVHRPPKSS